MRKITIGLLAAAGIACAAPANAQNFWFGAGPVGVGFGTAPYSYNYGSYWGGPYNYAPDYAYGYGYAPGYAYGPGYDVGFGYGPSLGYSYAPEYTYSTTYAAPAYVRSTYAYEPDSVVRVRTSRHVAKRHVVYRSTRRAYLAQASVPVRHVVKHSRRSVTIER